MEWEEIETLAEDCAYVLEKACGYSPIKEGEVCLDVNAASEAYKIIKTFNEGYDCYEMKGNLIHFDTYVRLNDYSSTDTFDADLGYYAGL